MKIIYLIRHGDYNKESPERGLTQYGRGTIRNAAESMKKELANRSELVIYHGSALRVVQSAQIIFETLGCGRLEERAELNCDQLSVHDVVEHAPDASIIVSHQPDLQWYLHQIEQPQRFLQGKFVRLER